MATTDNVENFDGYFPDDGYDYVQHMREINPIRFIEANVKYAKKAVPKATSPELAEVLAALESAEDDAAEPVDDSFSFNVGRVDERTRIGMLWGEDQVEEYLKMPTDRLLAIEQKLAANRMDDQSSTSSPNGDSLDFEKFFNREFGDSRIGGLTSEEVEAVDEEDSCSYGSSDESIDDDDESIGLEQPTGEDYDEIRTEGLAETKRFLLANIDRLTDDSLADDKDIVLVPSSNVPEWDCESVLSLRSNIYNHPGVILRPGKVGGIEGKKVCPVPAPIIEEEVESCSDDEIACDTPSLTEVSTFRPKNETSEERRARKQAIKQFQREQRVSKKSEEKERKAQISKAKLEQAILKRSNFGDVPDRVSKFAM